MNTLLLQTYITSADKTIVSIYILHPLVYMYCKQYLISIRVYLDQFFLLPPLFISLYIFGETRKVLKKIKEYDLGWVKKRSPIR